MSETLGDRLRQAREAKGIALEDAARATKIRVPRLRDLESGDFSNFPSLVYAKGFLKNYAEYLGVDASEYIGRLDTESSLDSEGYAYLAHEPDPDVTARRQPARRFPRIILAILAVLLLAVLALGYVFLRLSWDRLYPETARRDAEFIGTVAETGADGAAVADEPTPTPTPEPPPAVTPEDDRPIMRAIPVNAEDEPPPAPGPTYEVVIRPVERTWVKVIQDTRGNDPVYEDWLAPGDEPLTFTGSRFWITVMDQGAVEIRRNGNLVDLEGTALIIE